MSLIMLAAGIAFNAHSLCLNRVVLQIPEPRIQLMPGEGMKRLSIVVLVPVECSSGEALAPKDYEESILYLDIALPLDLKSSAAQGCGSAALKAGPYSPYRASADVVALKYLGELWIKEGYCKEFVSRDESLAPAACTLHLYEEFRRNYMPRAPWDFLNGVPSTPPTSEELDERSEMECDARPKLGAARVRD